MDIKPNNIHELERIISHLSQIPIEAIRSPLRSKNIVEARMVIWYIAYEYMHYSYSDIGKLYGKNHTTIMSGVQKIRKNGALEEVIRYIRKTRPVLLKEGKPITLMGINQWKTGDK